MALTLNDVEAAILDPEVKKLFRKLVEDVEDTGATIEAVTTRVTTPSELLEAVEVHRYLPAPTYNPATGLSKHRIEIPVGRLDMTDPGGFTWYNTPGLNGTVLGVYFDGSITSRTGTVSSIVSSTEDAGVWTHVLQMGEAVTNISVGDLLTIENAILITGDTGKQLVGAHPITNVDTGNNRLTITTEPGSAAVAVAAISVTQVRIIRCIVENCEIDVERGATITFNGLGFDETYLSFFGDNTWVVEGLGNDLTPGIFAMVGPNSFIDNFGMTSAHYMKIVAERIMFGGGMAYGPYFQGPVFGQINALAAVRTGIYFEAGDLRISSLAVAGQEDDDGFPAVGLAGDGVRLTINNLQMYYNDTGFDDLNVQGAWVTIGNLASVGNTVEFVDTTKNTFIAGTGTVIARP